MKKLFFILISQFCFSCAYSIHHVHSNPIEEGLQIAKGREIRSKAEQEVFLWFVTDNYFADEAMSRLINQCPQGRIEGIQTIYSTDLGFLSFVNRIRMKGFCFSS